MPDLSIIIVTYNSAADVVVCLESIQRTKGDLDVEVIVVDNHSKDDSVAAVRRSFPCVSLVASQRNLGFPAANNVGLAAATADQFLLLNPDTVLHEGALTQLIGFLRSQNGPAIVGLNLRNADGSLQSCGLPFPSGCPPPLLGTPLLQLLSKRNAHPRPELAEWFGYVSGAALSLNLAALGRLAGLDEHLFWWEDVDICYRGLQQGIPVYALAGAKVTHLSGRSAATNLAGAMFHEHVSKVRFVAKHSSRPTAFYIATLTILELAVKMAARSMQYLNPARRAECGARLAGYWRAVCAILSLVRSELSGSR